jgi:hypothetical protein
MDKRKKGKEGEEADSKPHAPSSLSTMEASPVDKKAKEEDVTDTHYVSPSDTEDTVAVSWKKARAQKREMSIL